MGIPIIGDIIDSVGDIVSEVVVDKDKRDEVNLQLREIEDRASQRLHEQMIAQAEVNKAEAQHSSIWVAGWRPFIGWIAGAGLAAQVILFPLLDRIFGWSMGFDTELLILTMSGMLGIGGLRSFDKWAGTDTKRVTAPSDGAVLYEPTSNPIKKITKKVVRKKPPGKGGPTNILPENPPWSI